MSSSTETAFREAYQAMLRLWPAPPEPREVATGDGARTHLQIWGRADAPPLVLLHGFQVTSTMCSPASATSAACGCRCPSACGRT